MENCLWEKLKGSTNNPNLPILETMQQFTLNAIAASGNNTMTDDQKWAFNHLFYALGAINDTALWSKIKIVHIPFLSLDVDHSCINYVDNADLINSASKSKMVLQNGCIYGTETINYILKNEMPVFDNKDFSFIVGHTTDEKPAHLVKLSNDGGSKDIIITSYGTVGNWSNGLKFGSNNTSIYCTSNVKLSGFSLSGSNTDSMFAFTLDNGAIVEKPVSKDSERYIDITQTGSTQLKIETRTTELTSGLSVLIVGNAISKNDMFNICDAVNKLMDEFSM